MKATAVDRILEDMQRELSSMEHEMFEVENPDNREIRKAFGVLYGQIQCLLEIETERAWRALDEREE